MRQYEKFLIEILQWVSMRMFLYILKCSGKIGIFSKNLIVHNFYCLQQ